MTKWPIEAYPTRMKVLREGGIAPAEIELKRHDLTLVKNPILTLTMPLTLTLTLTALARTRADEFQSN